MFGMMTVSAHERAMLDMECELQHARKELEYARRREKARIECVEALEGELKTAREHLEAAERKNKDFMDDYAQIARELVAVKSELNSTRTRCAFIRAEAERARSKIRELQLMKDSLESLWNARSVIDKETA